MRRLLHALLDAVGALLEWIYWRERFAQKLRRAGYMQHSGNYALDIPERIRS